MKKKTKFILLFIVVVGLLASLPWLRTQLAIDSCLDSGGRWSYAKEVCEYAEVK